MLLMVTFVACGEGDKPIDQQKFEAVYRASANIEQAIDGRTNIIEFEPLVRAFGTEVTVARSRVASEAEDALVNQYEAALPTLRDAVLLWSQSISPREDEKTAVAALMEKYGARATTDAQQMNAVAGRVLARARGQLQYAGPLYNGKTDAMPPPAL